MSGDTTAKISLLVIDYPLRERDSFQAGAAVSELLTSDLWRGWKYQTQRSQVDAGREG